jgi:cell wall-associated NlpC family hydrolase
MKLGKGLVIALIMSLLSGCITNPGDTANLKQHSGPVKVQSDGQSTTDLTEGRHIVPIKRLQNTAYVSLDDLTQAAGFHGAWLLKGNTYGVGDNDAAWQFKTAESAVLIAGKNVQMPAPAVKEGTNLYVPVAGLQKLFGDVTVFKIETDDIAFFPKPTPNETGATGKNLNFSDARPVKSMIAGATGETDKDTSTGSLITRAKKFMGVKYEFGAGDYEETGTFDCSSFTKYVFKPNGVDLPRIARQQAEGGTYVARDNLQLGDLLFYYVPNRFKSNEIVGHVGIYMGDGNMIHASPKPEDGVQVTPINKAYWKETFLYAKRYL